MTCTYTIFSTKFLRPTGALHCMYVQGYDDDSEKVKCLNSWGEDNNPEPEVPVDHDSNIFYQIHCRTELITSKDQLQAAICSGSKETYQDISKENAKKTGHLDKEVSEMLDKLNLGSLKQNFAEQELTINHLEDFDKEDYRIIGIIKIMDIKQIMEEVNKNQLLKNDSSSHKKVASRTQQGTAVPDKERSPYILISTPDTSQYLTAAFLGQYKLADGTHNGTVYYQQLNTVDSHTTRYCYRQAGKWWVGNRLGAENGWLCCDEGGDYPPATGWKHMIDWRGSLRDDPHLSVQDGLMTPCQAVTVSVSDNTKMSQNIAGEYHLVPDQNIEGRVILKHSSRQRFLMCYGHWSAMDKMSDDGNRIAYSKDGRRTVCPGQDHNTKWKIYGKEKYVTVTVKCHTHK